MKLPVHAAGTVVLDADDVIVAECLDPDGPIETTEECEANAQRIADALNQPLDAALAQARAEERERCARLADEAARHESGLTAKFERDQRFVCHETAAITLREIAARIRTEEKANG